MRRRDFLRAALAWTAAATTVGLVAQLEGPIRIEDTTWPGPIYLTSKAVLELPSGGLTDLDGDVVGLEVE